MTAFAWIRRGTGTYGPGTLGIPELDSILAPMIADWDAARPVTFAAFRRTLWAVAAQNEPLPTATPEEVTPDDWLCPIDDDDWHSPQVIEALADLPSTTDFAWWDIAAIRWVPPGHYRPLWLHEGRTVPGTCGYAVRARGLRHISHCDYAAIRDDHVFATTHAVRLGMRAVKLPITGGLWNVTPASISAYREYGALPPLPTPAEIDDLLSQPFPAWIRRGAEATADLIADLYR